MDIGNTCNTKNVHDYQKNNPSAFCITGQRRMHVHDLNTDDFPIEQVSWDKAEMYCRRITQMCRGLHYSFSLPTEAQWEYACRAGTNTPFYCGSTLTEKANCDTRIPYLQEKKTRNCPRRPTAVRTYSPNQWGIYDMHGNVYEWCADWYGEYSSQAVVNPTGPTNGAYKIYRGGSWYMGAVCARSAKRGYTVLKEKNLDLGFRVVLNEDF
ncbi:MAG: formylglycine-generating enzyme family protein [Planctomycetia bacterium]|nr:formylglycine-generating enzyme family protein [Planctomycetia bacterium]